METDERAVSALEQLASALHHLAYEHGRLVDVLAQQKDDIVVNVNGGGDVSADAKDG